MPAPVQLLVIVAAMLVFWAVVMRPARNQQKRVAQLQDSLEVGQEVVLSSGIFGTVRALTEARVELEVAPGTVLTVARQVVVRQVSELELSTAAEQETATDTHTDTHTDTDTHIGTGTSSDPGRATSDGPGESGPTKAED
jgi:preprotein translocase subunit YajC